MCTEPHWKYNAGTNIHKHALDAFYFDLTLQRPIQGSTPDNDVVVYTNGVSIMELLKIIDAYVAINNIVLDFVIVAIYVQCYMRIV